MRELQARQRKDENDVGLPPGDEGLKTEFRFKCEAPDVWGPDPNKVQRRAPPAERPPPPPEVKAEPVGGDKFILKGVFDA